MYNIVFESSKSQNSQQQQKNIYKQTHTQTTVGA